MPSTPGTPQYQVMKLYLNYGGWHHTCNPIAASATHNADPALFSVYSTMDAAGNSLTMMVLNNDPNNSVTAQFNFNGFTPSQVSSYTLSQSSPISIVAEGPQAWSSSITFAPYTATWLAIAGSSPSVPAAEGA